MQEVGAEFDSFVTTSLRRAWQNEKCCPEVLPYEARLISAASRWIDHTVSCCFPAKRW
jgi:hypothetical protein